LKIGLVTKCGIDNQLLFLLVLLIVENIEVYIVAALLVSVLQMD